jgi:glucan 1,3-beta-glucosidase
MKSIPWNAPMHSHIYHAFDENSFRRDWSAHIDHACNVSGPSVRTADRAHPTFTGEWSLATTDCTPWLRGFGNGSAWEGW